MWSERPKAFSDGLVASTAISLSLLAILSLWNSGEAKKQPESLCQEVVVIVERRGNILAQCPVGTYLDISDGANAVCRCGIDRQPNNDVDPGVDPLPDEETPNTEPRLPSDDGGLWL